MSNITMLDTLSNLPGLLCDSQIRSLCVDTDTPMISPFHEKLIDKGKISYGLSSFGYDFTLANKLKIARADMPEGFVCDPKNVDPEMFEDFEGDEFIIPPHGFALGHTNEIFNMPRDVMAICLAKSTFARCGNIIGVTPIEPGWRGSITLEFTNTLPVPVKMYAGEGAGQLLFLKGSQAPEVSYADRSGKYMDQVGIVLSRILQK